MIKQITFMSFPHLNQMMSYSVLLKILDISSITFDRFVLSKTGNAYGSRNDYTPSAPPPPPAKG